MKREEGEVSMTSSRQAETKKDKRKSHKPVGMTATAHTNQKKREKTKKSSTIPFFLCQTKPNQTHLSIIYTLPHVTSQRQHLSPSNLPLPPALLGMYKPHSHSGCVGSMQPEADVLVCRRTGNPGRAWSPHLGIFFSLLQPRDPKTPKRNINTYGT